MSKKFFIIVLVLMSVSFGYYGYLGGFNSPDITITTSRPCYVAGQYFEGPADSPAFGEFFKKAGRLQESGELNGSLANIYYNNPAAQGDTIKAFIGIQVADTLVALPPGYDLRTWPGGKKVVQVKTQAHYLLAPDKLYPALFDYLKANKLETSEQFLELFPGEDQASIEVVLIK